MPWRDQPAAGIVDVADRGPPRLEAVLAEPVVAIARRAAVIGLQHRIAPMREILRQPVEAPFVARARAAVRHHDRRQASCLGCPAAASDSRGFGFRRQPHRSSASSRQRAVCQLLAHGSTGTVPLTSCRTGKAVRDRVSLPAKSSSVFSSALASTMLIIGLPGRAFLQAGGKLGHWLVKIDDRAPVGGVAGADHATLRPRRISSSTSTRLAWRGSGVGRRLRVCRRPPPLCRRSSGSRKPSLAQR